MYILHQFHVFGIKKCAHQQLDACTSGRCNRQSEFTLLHFTIFH